MALKFPPPPTLASKDPETQRLNRWLIEIQSILNSDGTVNIGDSPVLTGVPVAPTAANGTDTTQIATTAFVINNAGTPATAVPLVDATPGQVGTSTHFARGDHVHPTDASRAPLASPVLTGTPTAPTAALGNNTTEIATTAFVLANTGAPPLGAWTPFTPAIGSQTGAFTTVSAAGSFQQVGKLVSFICSITITNAGTAAGFCTMALPGGTTLKRPFSCSGIDGGVTGEALCVFGLTAGASSLSMRLFNTSTAIASGAILVISGTYEAA